jgi:FkbM family methyltransferase
MSLAKWYGCSVVAIEPEPHNYARLVDNVELNNLEGLIRTYQAAVTKDGREVTIGGGGNNSGGHNIYGEGGEKLKSITLEQVFNLVNGFNVDLLKIDCEGAEHELLDCDGLGIIVGKKVKAIRGEFHGKGAAELLERVKMYVPDTVVTLQGAK